MQFVQRCPVELKVRFAYRKVRPGGVVGAAQADVFRHQTVIPAQAHAGEIEYHAPRAEFGYQPCLEKFRQADAIQVSEAAQQKQNKEKQADAAPAEVASKSLPETLLGGWRHIMGRRQPWPSDCAPLRCMRRRF